MPLARLSNGKLLYFAHVPKCAGTAVEHYLRTRFGPIGMLDPWFGHRSAVDAWSLTPPQHMPEAVRREILPDYLFDGIFVVVRHPAVRLRSVFLFQRDVEGALPAKMRFERWLSMLPRTLALDPYALHGHLMPMAEIVPDSAKIFRLEDGMEAILTWIDSMSEDEGGARTIAPANVLMNRLDGKTPDIPKLTPDICAQISALYPQDYDRFGYSEMPD